MFTDVHTATYATSFVKWQQANNKTG